MSSRGYPKRSARAAGITTYASSRRPRRSGAGAGVERSVVVTTENLGVPAVAWTKVLRYPSAPLDEPYFGRRPKSSFKVPIWVRVDELTEDEKATYDEVEKKREEQRALWKKEMEKRRDEADKELAQTKEEDQTKVDTNNGGAQEAPTEDTNDTSAMQVEPVVAESQTVKESAGEQNQINETTQQPIVDGSTVEAGTLQLQQ
jgi:hypothetical protein